MKQKIFLKKVKYRDPESKIKIPNTGQILLGYR